MDAKLNRTQPTPLISSGSPQLVISEDQTATPSLCMTPTVQNNNATSSKTSPRFLKGMVVRVSYQVKDRDKAGVQGVLVDLGEAWETKCRIKTTQDPLAWGDGGQGRKKVRTLVVNKSDLRPVSPCVGDHAMSLIQGDTRARARIVDVVRGEKNAVIAKFESGGGGPGPGAEGPFRIVMLHSLCRTGNIESTSAKFTRVVAPSYSSPIVIVD